MSSADIRSASRPQPDQPMVDIADYVIDAKIDSKEAYDTARYMLLDSLACAMLAMKFPECVKHLGPLVPGGELPGSGPLGQTVAKIDGRGSQLRLWFEGREPVSTSDPEALMEQQLGWSIPLRALRYWVRGEASASGGKADVQGNPTQPSVLEQDGWRVEYLAYHQSGGTALPAKLKMHHPNSIQATLIVNKWLLGDAACH